MSYGETKDLVSLTKGAMETSKKLEQFTKLHQMQHAGPELVMGTIMEVIVMGMDDAQMRGVAQTPMQVKMYAN